MGIHVPEWLDTFEYIVCGPKMLQLWTDLTHNEEIAPIQRRLSKWSPITTWHEAVTTSIAFMAQSRSLLSMIQTDTLAALEGLAVQTFMSSMLKLVSFL